MKSARTGARFWECITELVPILLHCSTVEGVRIHTQYLLTSPLKVPRQIHVLCRGSVDILDLRSLLAASSHFLHSNGQVFTEYSRKISIESGSGRPASRYGLPVQFPGAVGEPSCLVRHSVLVPDTAHRDSGSRPLRMWSIETETGR